MTDVKETKEFVVAAIKLGKFVAEQAKDGLNWKDAAALANKIMVDEAFRSALIGAIEGVQQIPAEVKDLSWNEGVELVTIAIAEFQK